MGMMHRMFGIALVLGAAALAAQLTRGSYDVKSSVGGGSGTFAVPANSPDAPATFTQQGPTSWLVSFWFYDEDDDVYFSPGVGTVKFTSHPVPGAVSGTFVYTGANGTSNHGTYSKI